MNNSPEPLTIFLHIPKTAGMSINWIIDQLYTPESVFLLDWTKSFTDAINGYYELPTGQKKQIRIIRGHMVFALRHLLPSNAQYFTLLRDPVERMISHYTFIKRTPHNYLYHKVTSKKLSLKDYIETIEDKDLDNGQIRYLADQADIPYGECSSEMLDSAKSNLKLMRVLGITEYFDESILLLKKAFSWRIPFYVKTNVSSNRPRQTDLTTETIEAIKKRNLLDIALYEYACEQFKQCLCEQPPSFTKELATFRLLNRLYGKIQPLYMPLKYKLQTLKKV